MKEFLRPRDVKRIMRQVFFSVLGLVLILSISAALAQGASDSDSTQTEQDTIPVRLLGTEIQIPKKYQGLLLGGAALFGLLTYAPRGYGTFREAMGHAKATRDALEVERMRVEILKTKYEIEAIKKTHGFALPEDDEEPTEVKPVAVKVEPTFERIAKQRQLIRTQVEQLDSRPRFVFRRISAFFFDYLFAAFAFGLVLAIVETLAPAPAVNFLELEVPYQEIGVAQPYLFGLYLYDYLLIAMYCLYFIVMWAMWGATVGCMIFGLRIVRLDGHSLTVKNALLRFVVFVISAPLSLGFLWLIWDKRKQSLPDKAAGTVVVKVRGRLKPEAPEITSEGAAPAADSTIERPLSTTT